MVEGWNFAFEWGGYISHRIDKFQLTLPDLCKKREFLKEKGGVPLLREANSTPGNTLRLHTGADVEGTLAFRSHSLWTKCDAAQVCQVFARVSLSIDTRVCLFVGTCMYIGLYIDNALKLIELQSCWIFQI